VTVVPDRFTALVSSPKDGAPNVSVAQLTPDDLGEGDVTVRVEWTCVNYKDGLAVTPNGRVARIDPLVPGVDFAGEVIASHSGDVQVGDHVIVHGHDVGVAHPGGFAEYARVPAEWVVPVPAGLDCREAMALGTAGFTAALSIDLLEDRGLAPDAGPVLVTGATGGVGSTAVAMLGKYGFHVVASTGKPQEAEWLREIGAVEIVHRDELLADLDRPLGKQRWAAAVDCVGGDTLAGILRTLQYGGAVAASGNTGGGALTTTVYPFILRGVAILGVDSVWCPPDVRRKIWRRLATDLKPHLLSESIVVEIEGIGDELREALSTVLRGGMRGRTLVRIGG
jgi:acrylyl-CoA reductase (NADPH)